MRQRSPCIDIALTLASFFCVPVDFLSGQAPPVPTVCAPDDVLPDEVTPVYVYGQDYTEDTVISIEGVGDLLSSVFLSADLIVGYTPPLDPENPNQPPGWKTITARRASGGPISGLPNGVRYVEYDEPYLTDCWPNEVAPAGGTLIHFYGRRFREGLIPAFEGVPCADPVLVSESEMTAISPPLEPRERHNFYVGEMTDGPGGPIVTRRIGALAVYADTAFPLLTSVEPIEVDARGGSSITIRGENLRNGVRAALNFHAPGGVFAGIVGGRTLEDDFLPVDAIDGVSPLINPLDPSTPPGLYELVYSDPRGESRLVDAIRIVDHIRSVTPTQLSSAGGTPIVFEGYAFSTEWTPRIGGVLCADLVFESAELVRAVSPPLPPGTYDADFIIADSEVVVAYLPQAFAVETPVGVTLEAVEPAEISSLGGATVIFTGTGFHAGLTPRLGGLALLSPTLENNQFLVGTAPDFPLVGSLLDADLVDADGNVVAELLGVVTVVPPPPLDEEVVLGPSQGEGELAEGEALFEWVNPVDAEAIHVFDVNGTPVTTLPGGTRSYKLPVDFNLDQVSLFFQAELASGQLSNQLQIIARRSSCEWPPPLTGIDRKGDLDLVLRGGNFLGEPTRCEAPTDFSVLPDLTSLGIRQIRETSFSALRGAGGGGDLRSQASIITSYTRDRLESIALDPELKYVKRLATSLFTGFRLERDADKLQLDAFYSMPVFAFGLKLKGRLIHAFPQDGFEDTFTFPDVEPSSIKRRNGVTYLRADRDVLDSKAKACDLKIPAGDYVLELYAEGGDPRTVHFVFETDGRNEEIIIPGVPCPPYPRVQVTNLTGLRSLPTIDKITGRQLLGAHPVTGEPMVELTAHGFWADEARGKHSLDESVQGLSSGNYLKHDFVFCWKVFDGAWQPKIAEIRGSNRYVGPVRTIGCYAVDLRVNDPDCPPSRPCNDDEKPKEQDDTSSPREAGRTFEAVVIPFSFQCNSSPYSLLNPSPDPTTVSGVVGFEAIPPGLCTKPRRTETFTIFVVPDGCCDGGESCPAATPADLQFRLTSGGLAVYTVAASDIEDLCQRLKQGPKYLKVSVDIDRISLLPGGDAGTFVDVWLEGKSKLGGDPWRRIGGAMRMTNRPAALTTSYSNVSYSKQKGLYQVILQSTKQAMQDFGTLPDSRSVPLFSGIAGAEIPSFPSSVNAGMNMALQIAGEGAWKPADAASTIAGEVLGNAMDGLPSATAGREILRDLDLPQNLEWQWSETKTILSTRFQQQLFQAILFTGSIGPIPVTVWGSVSLALGIDMLAAINVHVTPFAPALNGGNYLESEVKFCSKLTLSLPAELRTDILFGVASLTLSFIVEAAANFDASLRATNTTLTTFAGLYTKLDVSLGAKLCLFWFLCLPKIEIPLVEKTILEHPTGFRGLCTGAGGLADSGQGGGLGSGAAAGPSIKELLSVPASAVSPDGNQLFNLFYNSAQDRLLSELSTYNPVAGSVKRELIFIGAPELMPNGPFDVAAAYISNDRLLIAATATYPNESSVSIPIPSEVLPPRLQLNELKAQDEIVLCRFGTGVANGGIDSRVIRLADTPGEVTPADRRSDGRPAIAGNARFEDAIVAWVRIEDREYLVEDNTSTIVYEPKTTPAGVIFEEKSKDTTRARLETAAIYVRRVDFDGPIELPRKISTPGINLEPAIAFSPTGETAYCVWLNDPVHVDLIQSNRGRNLVYSVWTRATDTWSEPQPVLAQPDDFPGVLEPSLALKGNDRGLLVFSALPRDADPRDTGLNGANRFVYLSRLENGQFGTPVRVHGHCAKPIVARYFTVHVDPLQEPRTGPINPEIFFDTPAYVLIGQQTGAQGSVESSGNILVASVLEENLSAAEVSPVLADNRTHTNVIGALWQGGISTLNLKGGLAQVDLGAGGGSGGGVPDDIGYEPVSVALEPDLAIVACKLSNQFPGAGAIITATVEIENRGLAGSAMDASGQSVTAVSLVYTRPDGTETTQAESALPVLRPGERTTIEATIEMPLDPVRLRAEITSNPGDRDPSNDAQGCYFGAPPPVGFTCSVEVSTHASRVLLVELRWQNPVAFDEILLSRDGQPIAALPGDSTLFVDSEATPGLHAYDLRSRIGVSKSLRVATECEVKRPDDELGTFRRGDVDTSASLEITDAVRLLGFLFLGSSGPECPDAADADDNGRLEITDAIVILGYLFLGSAAPPAPGPDFCSGDASEDALPACGAACP